MWGQEGRRGNVEQKGRDWVNWGKKDKEAIAEPMATTRMIEDKTLLERAGTSFTTAKFMSMQRVEIRHHQHSTHT